MKRNPPCLFPAAPSCWKPSLLVEEFAPQLLDNPELLDRLPALFSLIVHSEP